MLPGLQVDVQPMQCADCVAPRTTMEFVQDTFGVVKLNMHTTMAGLYLITVTCNLTQVSTAEDDVSRRRRVMHC